MRILTKVSLIINSIQTMTPSSKSSMAFIFGCWFNATSRCRYTVCFHKQMKILLTLKNVWIKVFKRAILSLQYFHYFDYLSFRAFLQDEEPPTTCSGCHSGFGLLKKKTRILSIIGLDEKKFNWYSFVEIFIFIIFFESVGDEHVLGSLHSDYRSKIISPYKEII